MAERVIRWKSYNGYVYDTEEEAENANCDYLFKDKMIKGLKKLGISDDYAEFLYKKRKQVILALQMVDEE